ncbi:DUF4249 domain-containing protein [Microscilla marina]|uniref:Lipoprotein, putative n=1 Tax=Microscilla marina ATCC 23134 TaxID=313606 RepID=A1ZQR9_MICM2|nr:DUF4249 domain-containing protein [Microscilla marina]EAY27224.1 lipoprotein, putative [Microscilla marina ATCC 23134]
MRKILNKLIYSVLAFTVFASCTKIIEVDLNSAAPQLVIEGEVTDRAEPYRVKVSRTGDYMGNEVPPKVSGAMVTISDGKRTYTLQENTEQSGTYQTNAFVGTPGATYVLKVIVGETTYSAQSTMPNELLDFKVEQTAYFEGDASKGAGYYLQMYATDPQDEVNFYQWRFTINDTIRDKPEDLAVADDAWIQENIEGFQAPYALKPNDKVSFSMLAIPKATYEYYRALDELLFNDGGMFSPPPANPTGNVSGALGVFSAVSIKTKHLVIAEQ